MKKIWICMLAALMVFALTLGAAAEMPEAEEMDLLPEAAVLYLEEAELNLEEAQELPLPEEALTEPVDNGIPSGEAATPNVSDVEINTTNFPDEVFRTYVLSNFDIDGDGALSSNEIERVISIYVSDQGISSLEGIQNFTALQSLECHGNNLTSLDVSKFTELTGLVCYANSLKSLDVSKCTELVVLDCGKNALTGLDVSKCTNLVYLYCSYCKLTSLDVSKCTKLQELECTDNKLTALDVSKCTKLVNLICSSNKLTSLNVGKCAKLEWLECNFNKLTSLNVSKCTSLTTLACRENKLTGLDVSKCTKLVNLNPTSNKLTSLVLGKCTKLEWLTCEENNLTSLDLSYCKALKVLGCYNNKLTNLDLSKCTKLNWLFCEGNKLTNLNVSKCANLVDALEGGFSVDGTTVRYDSEEDETVSCDNTVVLTPQPATSHVAACTIAIEDQVYTGKALKPDLTVKYGDTVLTKGTDYTVSWKNNKKVGIATVTVKGKGDYKGKATATFKIVPKATAISKLTAKAKGFTAKWKKVAGVGGYQLQYSLKEDFSNKKSVTVKKAATLTKAISGLKAGNTYYVRVRTWQKVSGKTWYSDWSAVKSVTVK